MKLKCDKCGESLCDWFCCSDCEEKDWESNGKYLLAQEVLKWVRENIQKDVQSDTTFYGDMVDAEDLTCFIRGLTK